MSEHGTCLRQALRQAQESLRTGSIFPLGSPLDGGWFLLTGIRLGGRNDGLDSLRM